MPHPLDGIRLKLARAQKHLDEVARITKPFEIGECRVVPERSADGSAVLWVVHLPPVPDTLPVVIGDCLFNLRSALDHTVWQLVKANSARPTTRTAFPIAASAAAYKRASARGLAGVSAQAESIIERFQPYHGRGNPLAILSTLHNIDKHRRLNLVTAVASDTSLLWTRDGSLVYECIIGHDKLPHRKLAVGFAADSATGRQLLADNVQVCGKAAMLIAFDHLADADLRPLRVDTSLKQVLDFVRDKVVPDFELFLN